MNVTSIPFVGEIKTNYLANRCKRLLTQPIVDTLEISPKLKLERQSKAIFSRSQKFTIDDYNSLSRLEKSILREASSTYFKDADENIQVGLKVKEKLDKYHGENGYVFVSIGTSPAPIARVLEFMGVETKYLPITGLRPYYEDDKYKQFIGKFENYQKFLNEQGLSADRVKKSDKEFLFYDYTYSGQSLHVFKQMMKEYFGLNLPNVHFSSADFLCYSSCAKKIDPPDYAVEYVKKYMLNSNGETIGGIPHLPIERIDAIEECKAYESLSAKSYNFALIDRLNKMKKLKQNPNNKNSL